MAICRLGGLKVQARIVGRKEDGVGIVGGRRVVVKSERRSPARIPRLAESIDVDNYQVEPTGLFLPLNL